MPKKGEWGIVRKPVKAAGKTARKPSPTPTGDEWPVLPSTPFKAPKRVAKKKELEVTAGSRWECPFHCEPVYPSDGGPPEHLFMYDPDAGWVYCAYWNLPENQHRKPF